MQLDGVSQLFSKVMQPMKLEEVFGVLDTIAKQKKARPLSTVERVLLEGVWRDETYEAISKHSQGQYSVNYLKRDVGPKLWKLLSEALEEDINKRNFCSIAEQNLTVEPENAMSHPTFETSRPTAPTLPKPELNWGDAIQIAEFFGRTEELMKLKRWILDDDSKTETASQRCRVVSLLGIGGVGKTALGVKLAKTIQHEFEYVIWRSLHQVSSFDKLLADLAGFISGFCEAPQPATQGDSQIMQLLNCLKQHRCLVILDGTEAILEPRERNRYTDRRYGELIRHLGEEKHQSCLLLIGREKPADIALMEGEQLCVRSLKLGGLQPAAAIEMLQSKGFKIHSNPSPWNELIDRYSGNPHALKVVSTAIYELFNGKVTDFLEQKRTGFDQVYEQLSEQYDRLPNWEKIVIKQLTSYKEAVLLNELNQNVELSKIRSRLLDTIKSLNDRCLIEVTEEGFSLQPLVKEYVLDTTLEFQSNASLSTEEITVNITPNVDRSDGTNSYQTVTLNTLFSVINSFVQGSRTLRGATYNIENLDLVENLGDILTIAWSHTGQSLAIGDKEGRIHLWQVCQESDYLKNYRMWKEHGSWVRTIVFSPDDRLLVTGSNDRTIKLWNAQTGKVLETHADKDWVRSAAFSPNGKLLATGNDEFVVTLWQVSGTGDHLKIRRFENLKDNAHQDRIRSIAFSPDGTILASGSDDHTIKLWNIQTGQCETLEGHRDRVRSIAFSPDGELLASGSDDCTVRLWNSKTSQCIVLPEEHDDRVRSVAFSPNGQLLASGSDDCTVKLWDVNHQCCIDTFGCTRSKRIGRVQVVSFSPDGYKLASGDDNQMLKVWQIADRRLLSGESEHSCLKMIQGRTSRVRTILFVDRDTLISGHDTSEILVWDLKTFSCQNHSLNEHTHRVRTLASNGRLLVSGGDDCTVKLWNWQTGQCQQSLSMKQWVRVVALSPNGTTLAVAGDDRLIKLWTIDDSRVSNGSDPKILQDHEHWIRTITFSPNGKLLASGGDDQVVRLWDLKTGEVTKLTDKHHHRIRSIAFSPNGQYLASGSDDETIHVWDVATRKQIQVLEQKEMRGVKSVQFSPDSRILASGGEDAIVRLWDLSTGKPHCLSEGSHAGIQAIAFDPEGKRLVSSSHDGSIAVWTFDQKNGTSLYKRMV